MITREQAIQKLIDNTKFDFNSSTIEVYIYPEMIDKTKILNTFKIDVFSDIEEEIGWFIWIDPCTIANWSHPSFYYFITDDGFHIVQNGWMPNLLFFMDLLDLSQ